ncbi:hypothetical protein D9M68_197800 [compost metagenome]
MDVRRTVAVATEQVQHFLGGAIRRAAVAGRHDAAGAVAAVGVGEDAAAQVVFGLALVEVGVQAPGVGVPEIDGGAGDRVAVQVEDAAFEEHHGARVAAVVHPRLAFAQRRAGHVQRAFDGARGAAGMAAFGVPGVAQQVEEVLDAEAGHQQAGFAAPAQAVQVVHRGPELVVADLQVFDQLRGVLQDAQHDLLHARAALVVAEAGGFLEELPDVGRVGNPDSHVAPHRSLLLCGVQILEQIWCHSLTALIFKGFFVSRDEGGGARSII